MPIGRVASGRVCNQRGCPVFVFIKTKPDTSCPISVPPLPTGHCTLYFRRVLLDAGTGDDPAVRQVLRHAAQVPGHLPRLPGTTQLLMPPCSLEICSATKFLLSLEPRSREHLNYVVPSTPSLILSMSFLTPFPLPLYQLTLTLLQGAYDEAGLGK